MVLVVLTFRILWWCFPVSCTVSLIMWLLLFVFVIISARPICIQAKCSAFDFLFWLWNVFFVTGTFLHNELGIQIRNAITSYTDIMSFDWAGYEKWQRYFSRQISAKTRAKRTLDSVTLGYFQTFTVPLCQWRPKMVKVGLCLRTTTGWLLWYGLGTFDVTVIITR